MSGVTLNRNTSPYVNLTVSSFFPNSTAWSITVSTSHNCTVSKVHFSRIIIDKTAVESTLTTFMDCDKVSSTSGGWSALNLTQLPWSTPSNLVIAMSAFTLGATDMLGYNFNLTGLTCSATGTSNFVYL